MGNESMQGAAGNENAVSEAQFIERSEALLAQLEIDLERAFDVAGIDADIDRTGDGVLEIGFESGAKMIVNRHRAAREIWVAVRAGGFHFRLADEDWRDTRDAMDLYGRLMMLLEGECGRRINL